MLLSTLAAMLNLLADRWLSLTEELRLIGKRLTELTESTASHLLEQFGVGPYVAATLMVTAGGNPTRLYKEYSFATLCGVNPLEAPADKTQRHRLNRGSSRDANNALRAAALIRMRSDPRTRVYAAKRSTRVNQLKRSNDASNVTLLESFIP